MGQIGGKKMKNKRNGKSWMYKCFIDILFYFPLLMYKRESFLIFIITKDTKKSIHISHIRFHSTLLRCNWEKNILEVLCQFMEFLISSKILEGCKVILSVLFMIRCLLVFNDAELCFGFNLI